MSWNKEEALDKVKKLFALSKSDSEHEAAQAAAMAQRILTKYNLSIEDLSEVAEDDLSITEEEVAAAGRMSRWRTDLACGVAAPFGCRPLVYSGGRHTRLVIVGAKADTQFVKHMINYLIEVVERLTKQNGRGYGRSFANGYRCGLVARLCQRLQEEAERNKEELRQEATSVGTALVLQKGEALNKYMSKFTRSYSGGRRAPDPYGYSDGYSDGGDVSLNQQIGACA